MSIESTLSLTPGYHSVYAIGHANREIIEIRRARG
jgi:hypothetical protein